MATFTGTPTNDSFIGTTSNDLFVMGGSGGTDTIDGGAGFDSIEFATRATSAVIVDFAAGSISGGSSGTINFSNLERIVTGNFNDRLSGNASAQILNGHGGADTLWGAGGVDVLWGGAGADSFVFRETGTGNADSVRDFGSGTDQLVLDGSVMNALGATGNFAAGDARFKANSTGTATDASDRVLYNTTTRQLFYDADGNSSGSKVLIATLQSGATLAATDIVVEGGSGGGGGQTINGTSGNDSLVGGPGNDTINGFGGNDTIDGGGGFDTQIMAGGLAGAGIERIILRGYSGFPPADAHGNELDNIIIDEGPGVAFLYGNGGNDTLIGGSGVNYFVFEGDPSGMSDAYGHDSVDGGGGIDRLLFSNNDFAVTVDFRNGTVTGGSPVAASVTFANIEGVFGSTQDDLMFASDRGDQLGGYDGDDTVIGGAGDDDISGDGGFDNPGVNFGNDRLLGGGGNDAIGGQEGADWIDGGAGNDDLFGDNVLGGGWVDSFAFTVAPGAANADAIHDFVSAEDLIVLDGAVHANSGASGRFAAGDARFAANSTGTAQDASDRVVYNTSNGQLWYDADGNGAGARQLIVTVLGAPTLGALNIEVINGGGQGGPAINGTPGNDSLAGGPGSDTINGFDGEDTIDGGAGADSMLGGAHADTYFVDNSGDTIVELDGGGFDTVHASVSYTLPAWVNHLVLTGSAALNGGGNELPNAITGNGGNNILTGGGGNDTINGGAGFDSIDLGSGATGPVVVDFAAGTISGSSGTISFAAVERVIASHFNDRLTGNAAAQTLVGQGGADTLWGAAGVDVLWGGGGADTFVFRETGSANADSIRDWTTGADEVALDDSVMTALGATGNFVAGDGRFWAAAGATAGHDANDRVIYNTSTGSLYYDADGSGSAAAQLIATFAGTPAVAGTDIVVI